MSRFRFVLSWIVALLFWQSRPAPPSAGEKRLFTKRRRRDFFRPSGATQTLNQDSTCAALIISAGDMTPQQLLDFEERWRVVTRGAMAGPFMI